MNNGRRRELSRICGQLEQALSDLEVVQAEEEDCRDNTPENLQGTERYAECEEACENLDAAVAGVNDAIDAISQITG